MHAEVEELRPKLKELLYDCAVKVGATKAALFLLDAKTQRFELIIEYGFRGDAPRWIDRNNPIADRCGRGNSPFYVNGVAEEPQFAEVLFQTLSDRILAVPLMIRGRLVGVIDMRDKPAKVLFRDRDLAPARRIGDSVMELFEERNVFGLRFLTLSEAEDEPPEISAQSPGASWVAIPGSAFVAAPLTPISAGAASARSPERPATLPPLRRSSPSPGERGRIHVPQLATLVADAREAVEEMVAAPVAADELSDIQLAGIRDSLRSLLMVPGVRVAVFTAFGHQGGIQEIVSDAIVTDEARGHLLEKIEKWLAKRGVAMHAVETKMNSPRNPKVPPLIRASVQKVFTAPMHAGALRDLYLTVGFSEVPDHGTHDLLAAALQQMKVAIEYPLVRDALSTLRQHVADKLLEPDFRTYPELKQHSDAVAELARRFALFLSMAPEDVDTVTLLAKVHDVGMRLLDYERLYRKPKLSADEMEILREHPIVGAALVEPLLGPRIARAVLTHHERVDGRGYPHGLRSDDIPLATRIIQVCDAYVVMTDAGSYAPVRTHAEAVAVLQSAAGSHLDGELTARFVSFLTADAGR